MKEKIKKEAIRDCTILVVDDDPVACKELSDILEEAGFIVSCAGNGAQAKKIVFSTDVNVVLLDLKLPDSFGLDLIKIIKEAQNDAHIIVITAYASLDSTIKAIKNQVSDFFTKPYSPEKIVESVKKCAEKQMIKRELDSKMDALESFSKIATGRELKMVKLKEEVNKLKEKLRNCKI